MGAATLGVVIDVAISVTIAIQTIYVSATSGFSPTRFMYLDKYQVRTVQKACANKAVLLGFCTTYIFNFGIECIAPKAVYKEIKRPQDYTTSK